jgi:hypothetical protein
MPQDLPPSMIPWPGPVSVNQYVQTDNWPTECPTTAEVSIWLAQIWGAFGENNGPFEGTRLDLWSYQRQDNPLLAKNREDLHDRDGETLLKHIALSMVAFNLGTANEEVQGLLSHEFGHRVWWWIGFGEHSPTTEAVWKTYLTARGLPHKPEFEAFNTEVWAEDFRYYFGALGARNRFGLKNCSHPSHFKAIRWFMLNVQRVVAHLKTKPFDSLSFKAPAEWGDKGYWIWHSNGEWQYTAGDNNVYRLTNTGWKLIVL